MKRKANNQHFVLETRKIIHEGLVEGKSISTIANEMGRHKSSIIREIQRNQTYVFTSTFNNSHPCLKCETCPVKSYECYKYCKDIEFKKCNKLLSSPHTCDGCKTKSSCRYVKIYYNPNEANDNYKYFWSANRQKLRYTEEERNILNTDFVALVYSNRSIYHSLSVLNNRGFNFKLSTVYWQIQHGYINIPKGLLPRQRKKKANKVDRTYKKLNYEGHTYEDYEKFKRNNPTETEIQMDTVEGIKDSNQSVMLTLQIVEIDFLMIFKLEAKKFEKTIEKLQYCKKIFSEEVFRELFAILLTDNGVEFTNIEEFVSTFPSINIFYCHPYSSFEKGDIENNHELIRRVIPKGITLNIYEQNDYDLICSHINSLKRKSLDGKCPFDLVDKYISKEILNELGIHKIEEDKVTLNPYLLGEKNIANIKKYLSDEDIEKANIFLSKLK